MKHTPVTKLCNYILTFLGFAGAASCDVDPGDEIPCMYGILIETYRVFGKVVDQDSNLIPGIKIEGEGPA